MIFEGTTGSGRKEKGESLKTQLQSKEKKEKQKEEEVLKKQHYGEYEEKIKKKKLLLMMVKSKEEQSLKIHAGEETIGWGRKMNR